MRRRPVNQAPLKSNNISLEWATVRLFRRLAARRCRLHPRGAKLEFGNLAERVERGIGELVRRRLDIGEGNEHNAIRNGIVLPRLQFDLAARVEAAAPRSEA